MLESVQLFDCCTKVGMVKLLLLAKQVPSTGCKVEVKIEVKGNTVKSDRFWISSVYTAPMNLPSCKSSGHMPD